MPKGKPPSPTKRRRRALIKRQAFCEARIRYWMAKLVEAQSELRRLPWED